MSLVIPSDNKKYYSTHLSRDNVSYLKQSIFNYWISSSHNTYLPYGQTFDESSECYYKLILNVYFGGCVEIDTDGINKKMDDVVITHLATNSTKISLRNILRVVLDAVKTKESKNIVSGPIILTFDNKKLTKRSQHNVFWKVLEEEVLNEQNYKYVAIIDDKFDLTLISIDKMSNKILLRWGENTDEKCKSPNDDIGKELCLPQFSETTKNYIKTDKHWFHLLKGHEKFGKSIMPSVKNKTVSVSVPAVSSYKRPSNYNLVLNLQRNIMRIYPNLTYTMSQNYNNMKYFRDGVQIVALNLQYISQSWHLNKAVFTPNTGYACSPKETKQNKIENSKCHKGWKNSDTNPLAYRLKPLWLMGLIPNPGMYKLYVAIKKCSRILEDSNGKITLEDVSKEYTKCSLTYGLTDSSEKASILQQFSLNNVDVTVPFFVLEIMKPVSGVNVSTYTSGIEIPWSIEQLHNNNIIVDVHKILTKNIKYNKVNTKDICETSTLFNIEKQLRIELEYSWEYQGEIKEMVVYNNDIVKLRTSKDYKDKSIEYLLSNISELHKYQMDLAMSLIPQPAEDTMTDFIDESLEAKNYDKNITSVIESTEK